MKEIPYFANYSRIRRFIHDICNSKYFDLVIAGVIGLNVVTMSLEFYSMPKILEKILDIFNYIFKKRVNGNKILLEIFGVEKEYEINYYLDYSSER